MVNFFLVTYIFVLNTYFIINLKENISNFENLLSSFALLLLFESICSIKLVYRAKIGNGI